MIERNIESYFINKCKKLKIFTIKNTGMRGIPDRLCVCNGRTIWVELKKPGEVPRPLQNARIAELEKHGAEVYVLDNKQDIDTVLNHLAKKPTKKKYQSDQ